MDPLRALLSDLLRYLADEVGYTTQTQTGLVFGRPHEYGRTVTSPRYTVTGDSLGGRTHRAPDCPRPRRGVCECSPDGSWRPFPPQVAPDAVARHYRDARETSAQDFTLVLDYYERGPDALWRCRYPYRRALDRLRSASLRRYLILTRLLDGRSFADAFEGFGEPSAEVAQSIIRQVLSYAEQEMTTEWERPPRTGRPDPIGWTSLSESQQNAVSEGEAA